MPTKTSFNLGIVKNKLLISSIPVRTLSEVKINAKKILEIFLRPTTKVTSGELVSRFVNLNRENLKFLDTEINEYYNNDSDKGVIIRTGRYAGSIPLKSPVTSLYTIDLRIEATYSPDLKEEDIFNLLTEMDRTQMVEFNPHLTLISSFHRPPNYIECQNFMMLYLKAKKYKWTKFINQVTMESHPRGLTDWVNNSMAISPKDKLLFKNKINTQTILHEEWKQINYVALHCLNELFSPKTPISIKSKLRSILTPLKKELNKDTIQPIKELRINSHDPQVIKQLKQLGNSILKHQIETNCAWRFDVAEFFESYSYFIFHKISGEFGWFIKSKPHFPISGVKKSWNLSYLEPDILLYSNLSQIIIDAKYKSHMLSGQTINDSKRKETYRNDLHQVLGYSTFNQMKCKPIILIYPGILMKSENEKSEEIFETLRYIKQEITTPFSDVIVDVFLLSLPVNYSKLPTIFSEMRSFFKKYLNNFK